MFKSFFRLLMIVIGMSAGETTWAEPLSNSPASSITLPSDPIHYQQAPGSDIASSYCLICHSAEYVYMQPPHHQETWTNIVHKMKSAFGCPIPEEQISPLVSYLVRQNDKQPAVLASQAEPGIPSTIQNASAEKGHRVYQTYCANCHGASGKGDGPVGKILVPPAADLTATTNKPDEELLKSIRDGRPGTAMPSWKNDLSQQDILNVLAYVRSLGQ